MKIYAHRGFSSIYPEHSLSAIEEAFKQDYIYGIEIDVRMTKDKKFVLIHDAIIDHISNKSGRVCDFTLEELKKIKLHTHELEYKKNYITSFFTIDGKETRKRLKKLKDYTFTIVTLNHILEILKDKVLLIEIKHQKDCFDINKFYKLIKKYMYKKIEIQSFHKESLDKFRKLDTSLSLGMITTGIKIDKKEMKKYDFISIEENMISKDLLNETPQINVWTVNSHHDIKEINKKIGNQIYHVGIITDHPDKIVKYLKKMKKSE